MLFNSKSLLIFAAMILAGEINQTNLWRILGYAEMAEVEKFKADGSAWDFLRGGKPRWVRRVG